MASPKHRYDMTEVDSGGGGHRTRLKDQLINLCVLGCPPAPVYKGARGRPADPVGMPGGVLLLVGVGLPSFLLLQGGGKEGGEGEGKGGATPLPSLLLQLGKGGILLPVGVGLPLGRAIEREGPPLLHSFIYGGRGHPKDTTIDPLDLLAMCSAPLHHNPPRSYRSGA